MAATTALREALNQGISSGSLVDTKIILYSHRDSSGRICRPKALYASSHVLKTVPYFNDCGYTAALDIAREEPHTIVSKYSSETLQSLSLGTSRKHLTKKDLRRTTAICPIATLRTMRMIRPPRPSRRPVRPTRSWSLTKTRKFFAKNTRNALIRGRSPKSRTWRS